MFVTGLLEDWMRKLEEGRRRRQREQALNSPRHYQAFLTKQQTIWTPVELFEKCCPQFLAGGVGNGLDSHHQQHHSSNIASFHSVRRKDGTYSCPGGCNKAHPTITLFFDAKSTQTVAILSHLLDPFTTYLNHRVHEEKTATCKTPYYYELEGFVRENLHQLEHLFGQHLVKVAMGALQESDQAQSQIMEDEYKKQNYCQTSLGDKLEKVLQICSMHRLYEDLDVLSIHCMQQTNRTFRKIASPMAEQRLKDCQLVVTPQVDGYYVSGYSVFRRIAQHLPMVNRNNGNSLRPTVLEREHGRMIEYAMTPSWVLCRQQDQKSVSVSGRLTSTVDKLQKFDIKEDVEVESNQGKTGSGEFSWECVELSFANLEREWGDLGVTEYVGQKIVVHWRRDTADIVEENRTNFLAGSQMWRTSSPTSELPIFDARLSSAIQKPGIKTFAKSEGFRLVIQLKEMSVRQVDDVTVSFQGSANILHCQTRFEFLVRAYAKSLAPHLRARQQEILKTRPLYEHEQTFCRLVERMTSSAKNV